MRTNIELDDELIAEAMAASGLKTKKATIEAALPHFGAPAPARYGYRRPCRRLLGRRS
jgi:Arc/MetJ family transcription regulator